MITNMATLTLIDKAATPASHVFTPIRSVDGVSTWVDREHSNGLAIGYSRVGYSVREPLKQKGVYRHTLTFAMPLLSLSVPSEPVLLATARANLQLLLPDVMTDQHRKDFLEMFNTILKQGLATTLGDNIVTQTQPY